MRLLGAVFLFILTLQTFSDKGAFKYALTTAVDPVYGVNQENTVTAVNLALESVNNSSSLLSGLSLSYGNVSMLEASAIVANRCLSRQSKDYSEHSTDM